jgi:hypothetical protein
MAAPSEFQAAAASRVGRSGTADDTAWTRIEREHGAPPVGMHPVYAIIPFFSFRFFRSYTYYSLAETGELSPSFFFGSSCLNLYG